MEIIEVKLPLRYEITRWETGNTFKAKDKGCLGENKVVTCSGFSNVGDTLNFLSNQSSFSYKPILRFQAGSYIATVGKDVGVSLAKFISLQKEKEFCEFESYYLRMEKGFRDFFRQIAIMLYSLHSQRNYVGDDLRCCVFVSRDDNGRFSLSLMGGNRHSCVENGVWYDILNFKEVILYTVELNSYIGHQHGNMIDLQMFLELFPETAPTSFEKLRDLSYFVCHAPLFWNFEQRYSFCYSYYQIRNQDKNLFDFTLKLEDYGLMKHDWKLCITDPDLALVLKYTPSLYNDVHGLIPFHRCALVHHDKNVRSQKHKSRAQKHKSSSSKGSSSHVQRTTYPRQQDVDMKLLKLFPFALPIAYTAFYKKLYGLFDGLAEFLRNGPAGLDYNDLIVQRKY